MIYHGKVDITDRLINGSVQGCNKETRVQNYEILTGIIREEGNYRPCHYSVNIGKLNERLGLNSRTKRGEEWTIGLFENIVKMEEGRRMRLFFRI